MFFLLRPGIWVSEDIRALDQVDSLSVLIFIKLCFSNPVTVGRMSVDMRT